MTELRAAAVAHAARAWLEAARPARVLSVFDQAVNLVAEGGAVLALVTAMSERTSRQAISQLAATLFKKGAAERVIVAAMPKLRAAMHLDTIFTFADRDCVLYYPDIVNHIHAYSYRPGSKPGTVDLRPPYPASAEA